MNNNAPGWRQVQEIRDRVQFRLALLSMVIWLLVAFSIVLALGLAPEVRAPRVLSAGFVALAFAALPWANYPRQLARALHRAGLSTDTTAEASAPSAR